VNYILSGTMLFVILLTVVGMKTVTPLQFYCNTVPLLHMIDERENVILRAFMCLPHGVSSDYMCLCSKNGVRPT